MKKFTIIIFVLIFCQITVSSQPCLPDGIEFTTQAQIDNFQNNYPTCTEIAGYVIIDDDQSDDITNLNGLSVLTSIWGNLWIGGYYYRHNRVLTSLTGLDNVTSIGGNLTISNNGALTTLTGLDAVTSIGGDLWIGYNYDLTSLTGLDNVTSIWRSLVIFGNYGLKSLTGLDNVTSIGGMLEVSGNKSLNSLMGLDNINAGSITDLRIGGHNNSLNTCEVQSVCDYLASPTGTIYISGNATGCNSQIEVEEACATVTVNDLNFNDYFSLYPNPAKDILTISCKNGTTIEEVVIYNQTGQIVFEGGLSNNTIDVSGLRQGMYIVELVSKDWKVWKKLIVE